jgi:hypothetical protein
MTFEECNAARNYMKQAAQSGNCAALNWRPPQASYPTNLPSYPQPSYPTQLPSYPQQPSYPTQLPSYPPSQPVSGGGYYGGVYYSDQSGICG